MFLGPTYVTGLQVGFLGTDQHGRVSNSSVPVLHLFILFLVFNLSAEQKTQQVRYLFYRYLDPFR